MTTLAPIALLDACVLCSPIKRNLLLNLAAEGLFQARWSEDILAETQRAIAIIAEKRQHPDPVEHGRRVYELIVEAFPGQSIGGFDAFNEVLGQLPDEGDRHVIAAAVKAGADIIVTENLRDFPRRTLARFDIEPVSSDNFIMDIINLSPDLSASVIERTRRRFQRADKTPEVMLQDMKRAGLRRCVEYLTQRQSLSD
ncbi:MAG: PIN domain-containing protein [Lysobacterales bacterium]